MKLFPGYAVFTETAKENLAMRDGKYSGQLALVKLYCIRELLYYKHREYANLSLERYLAVATRC